MTTTNLGPRESQINWLNQYSQKMNEQVKWMKDYKTFCEMDHETLEKYLSDRVPVPPKDEPFTDELLIPGTNPLSMDMSESIECLNLLEIIVRGSNLFIALLATLVVWLVGGHALVWILLGIGVVVDQWLITLQLNARKRKFRKNYAYVANLSYSYLDPAIDHQTFWNSERLKKWAVARYDFTSTETFMMIMGDGKYTAEGMMMEEGPMAGRFVSTSTGEEWPLKPTQVEAA